MTPLWGWMWDLRTQPDLNPKGFRPYTSATSSCSTAHSPPLTTQIGWHVIDCQLCRLYSRTLSCAIGRRHKSKQYMSTMGTCCFAVFIFLEKVMVLFAPTHPTSTHPLQPTLYPKQNEPWRIWNREHTVSILAEGH